MISTFMILMQASKVTDENTNKEIAYLHIQLTANELSVFGQILRRKMTLGKRRVIPLYGMLCSNFSDSEKYKITQKRICKFVEL